MTFATKLKRFLIRVCTEASPRPIREEADELLLALSKREQGRKKNKTKPPSRR